MDESAANDSRGAAPSGVVTEPLCLRPTCVHTRRAPKRLITDNAWSYTRRRDFAALLGSCGIKHLRTKAYRPRTNGKVERFHQTMAREWAYGLVYRSSEHRRRALPYWLRYYKSAAHSEKAPDQPRSERPYVGTGSGRRAV